MKYITTKKHPEYKEGLIFEAEYPAYFVLDRNRVIEEDLQRGYIKEVEKKEFTKSDMINFSIHVVSPQSRAIRKDVFKEWQKHR
jgi:hypothetical protein